MRSQIEADMTHEEPLNLLAYLADEIVKLSEANGTSGKGMLLMLHYMFMVFGEQETISATSLDGILNVIEERLEKFNISKIDHPKGGASSTRMIIH